MFSSSSGKSNFATASAARGCCLGVLPRPASSVFTGRCSTTVRSRRAGGPRRMTTATSSRRRLPGSVASISTIRRCSKRCWITRWRRGRSCCGRPKWPMSALAPRLPSLLVERRISARLVVGADGRGSRVRAWAGFPMRRDPSCFTAVGTLYRGLALPDDAVQFVPNPETQRLSIIFPIGGGRFRTYFVFEHGARPPLSGRKDQQAFVDESVAAGRRRIGFGMANRSGRSLPSTRRTPGPTTPIAMASCWSAMRRRQAIRASAAAFR